MIYLTIGRVYGYRLLRRALVAVYAGIWLAYGHRLVSFVRPPHHIATVSVSCEQGPLPAMIVTIRSRVLLVCCCSIYDNIEYYCRVAHSNAVKSTRSPSSLRRLSM